MRWAALLWSQIRLCTAAACCSPQVAPEKHQEGLVVHTVGYPLPSNVYGGSFIYHMSNNLVALG